MSSHLTYKNGTRWNEVPSVLEMDLSGRHKNNFQVANSLQPFTHTQNKWLHVNRSLLG